MVGATRGPTSGAVAGALADVVGPVIGRSGHPQRRQVRELVHRVGDPLASGVGVAVGGLK
jgi:hypothetical protein